MIARKQKRKAWKPCIPVPISTSQDWRNSVFIVRRRHDSLILHRNALRLIPFVWKRLDQGSRWT